VVCGFSRCFSRAGSFALEQSVGGRDQLGIRVRSAIAGKFFGVSGQLIAIDHRRVVLSAIVAVKPSENERDVVLGGGLELCAGP
jgi:hypothetical protein